MPFKADGGINVRHLAKFVEQLDFAANLLCQGQPTAARLALILTDNVVELLVHERCEAQLRADARGLAPDSNRLAATEAAKVLGQKLKPKIDFLVARKVLQPDEKLLIQFAHRMRNEAYHQGVVHEPILSSVGYV